MNVETNNFYNGLRIRNLKEVVENTLRLGGAVACFHFKKPYFQYTIGEERSLSPSERLSGFHNKSPPFSS